eukprot:TRINITY_DN7412_c0_g1_i1.p1 TRINITY_DN7412_c0_g1~~TRINITY_DN7412_c0_g1_i1.p1  ORF type:complete len:199 (+),score=47.95 TRINITY_DN7412_c0_g1_i1:102-698(+)
MGNLLEKMKIALVVVLTALVAGSFCQVPASQAYLVGHHNGLSIGANTQIISYINDTVFSPVSIANYLGQAASANPYQRLAGLQNLYGFFYNFSTVAYNIITKDQNFTTAMNYTLTLLASPQNFQYRADVFQRQTGFDVYVRIAQATNLAKAGDFYNCGVNFGWVIYNLRNVVGEEDILSAKESAIEQEIEASTNDLSP